MNDAVDFMRFILSDEVQVEGYAKLLNMTTRGDMSDNKYFKEIRKCRKWPKPLLWPRRPTH